MSSDEQARRAKADRLRQQIEGWEASLKVDELTIEPDVGTTEMLPGESPRDYVERRTREIERKRRLGLSKSRH